MAEAVGLVASVTALATFGGKLSLSLYEYASSITSARSEVIAIGQEISLSCAVLQQVACALQGDRAASFSPDALSTTSDILGQCRPIYDEIESILASAKNSDAGGKETQMGLGKKVVWVYRRSKIRRLMGSLDALKLTLQMMLMTLQFSSRMYATRNSTVGLHETIQTESDEAVICQSLVVAQQMSLETLQVLEQDEGAENSQDEQQSSSQPKPQQVTNQGKKRAPPKPPSTYEFLVQASSASIMSRRSSIDSIVSVASRHHYELAERWTRDGEARIMPTTRLDGKSIPRQPLQVGNDPGAQTHRTSPSPAEDSPSDRLESAESENKSPISQQEHQSTIPSSAKNVASRIELPQQISERWETLSAHWEGLTSYWIRKMEQDKVEIDKDPIYQQLAKQVADLSNAGANLFHAVAELHQLRASSERKFQRWFFETRAELEKGQEANKTLENALENRKCEQRLLETKLQGVVETNVALKAALEREKQDKADTRSSLTKATSELEGMLTDMKHERDSARHKANELYDLAKQAMEAKTTLEKQLEEEKQEIARTQSQYGVAVHERNEARKKANELFDKWEEVMLAKATLKDERNTAMEKANEMFENWKEAREAKSKLEDQLETEKQGKIDVASSLIVARKERTAAMEKANELFLNWKETLEANSKLEDALESERRLKLSVIQYLNGSGSTLLGADSSVNGDEGSKTGDEGSKTGDERSKTQNEGSKTGGERSKTGGVGKRLSSWAARK